MIISFKHKGLESFYGSGSTKGIKADQAKRLRLILTKSDQAESSGDMDLPGLKLHRLKGPRKNVWCVSVSGNWRATFQFTDRNAEIVNYEDYH